MSAIYWLVCAILMICIDKYLHPNVQVMWACGVFMGIGFVHLIKYLETRTKRIISYSAVTEDDIFNKILNLTKSNKIKWSRSDYRSALADVYRGKYNNMDIHIYTSPLQPSPMYINSELVGNCPTHVIDTIKKAVESKIQNHRNKTLNTFLNG